jgi:hypothetical protein
MSNLQELQDERHLVTRALKVDHPYIIGGQEVNFASVEQRPTMFRALMYQSEKQSEQDGVLKGEDVITLYHKNFGAYLHFDPKTHADPVFYTSKRVSSKARKKCAWMWQVEHVQVMEAGHGVTAAEDAVYRLKHLVSGTYLIQRGETLGVTSEYLDPATLFNFKQFLKYANPSIVKHEDMVFVRSGASSWLSLSEEDDDDDVRTVPSVFRKSEAAPDMDAVIILPIRAAALRNVLQVRRLCMDLIDYEKELEALPDMNSDISDVMQVLEECYTPLGDTSQK